MAKDNGTAPKAPETLVDAYAAAKDVYADNQAAHGAFAGRPYDEKLYGVAVNPPAPWVAIVDALVALGWKPPVEVPDGVQVWTISGTPAEVARADGTMAYLSLPNGEDWLDVEDRGDIWLENPVIDVNFERPRKEIA
ncbi:hypothetical protein [Arthrobacter sp. N1]|uniref:hypothetical protein n=1 Tax=Arthrobacter sp. N1 TaxID=619291 RepID=UPI003BB157A4